MTGSPTVSLSGSCLCGAVAYVLEAVPDWAHCCHCSRCRKSRGSAFAANLIVPLEALRFTRGADKIASYRPPDAERFKNDFCSICGSNVPFANTARGRAVVPMGSLDDAPPIGPKAHIFVASKAPWYEITDALPVHPREFGSGKA